VLAFLPLIYRALFPYFTPPCLPGFFLRLAGEKVRYARGRFRPGLARCQRCLAPGLVGNNHAFNAPLALFLSVVDAVWLANWYLMSRA
jgi:hypothetical protein